MLLPDLILHGSILQSLGLSIVAFLSKGELYFCSLGIFIVFLFFIIFLHTMFIWTKGNALSMYSFTGQDSDRRKMSCYLHALIAQMVHVQVRANIFKRKNLNMWQNKLHPARLNNKTKKTTNVRSYIECDVSKKPTK